MIGRIGREELIDLLRRESLEQNRTLDLFVHIAAQIPGHGFAPGQAVDRRPHLDFVRRTELFQHGIFKAQGRAVMILEIGIDAIRIGLQYGSGFGA